MYKNKKGFTLIELLAVIVILGILLAISTVAVNSIRKSQEKENRRNTISGILTGARRYVSDNNSLLKDKASINVSDIVDGNYADLDTNEYSDIYKGNVIISICENNTNKVKYSYTDNDTTYNDCGCEEQQSRSTSSELCTE